jgi:hypothetical protein
VKVNYQSDPLSYRFEVYSDAALIQKEFQGRKDMTTDDQAIASRNAPGETIETLNPP